MHALQARLKNQGEVTVVQFSGRIDIESAPPFRQACRTHLKGKKIVFDFAKLSFVGSTGILPFLEALEEFTKTAGNDAKFSGVGLEFGRVLSATTLGLVEVWETEAQAVDAYTNPRLIEMALAHREALSGIRLAAAVAPVSSTAGVTPTNQLTKATEPKNFGLLALSYEAEEPKNSDLEELED